MYYSEKERDIIRPFYKYLSDNNFAKEQFLLIWKNGTKILADIDGTGDDDNGLDLDDPNYEDYTSFVIRVAKICRFNKSDGFPNYWFEEGKLTDFNYHNFPCEIYNSRGELISKRED